jgi:hypothetical protein
VTTPAEARHLARTTVKAAIEHGVPVVSESFIWQTTDARDTLSASGFEIALFVSWSYCSFTYEFLMY